jgi:hypothetical protein
MQAPQQARIGDCIFLTGFGTFAEASRSFASQSLPVADLPSAYLAGVGLTLGAFFYKTPSGRIDVR